MATNNGDLLKIVHAGTWGNGSKHNANHNFVDEAQNDVVLMAKIPAGTEVFDIVSFFEAFGAARTIDLGYKAVDATSSLVADPDYWSATPINVAAIGANRANVSLPIRFTEDVYLTATLAGAAGADAELHCVVDYTYHGNL